MIGAHAPFEGPICSKRSDSTQCCSPAMGAVRYMGTAEAGRAGGTTEAVTTFVVVQEREVTYEW